MWIGDRKMNFRAYLESAEKWIYHIVEQSLSSFFDIFFSSLIIFDVFHFTSKDHKIFQNIGKKLKKNFVHLTIIPFLYGTFKKPISLPHVLSSGNGSITNKHGGN